MQCTLKSTVQVPCHETFGGVKNYLVSVYSSALCKRASQYPVVPGPAQSSAVWDSPFAELLHTLYFWRRMQDPQCCSHVAQAKVCVQRKSWVAKDEHDYITCNLAPRNAHVHLPLLFLGILLPVGASFSPQSQVKYSFNTLLFKLFDLG